jgi:hypothetical protein
MRIPAVPATARQAPISDHDRRASPTAIVCIALSAALLFLAVRIAGVL